MIEPQFNVYVPDAFYAPLDGAGRWCDVHYDGGIAGVLWTNDAAGLDTIRVDWREEAQETIDEMDALRIDSMAKTLKPIDVFDNYAKGDFFSGILNKDLLQHVRDIMVFDSENTKYYHLVGTNDTIKVTDTQPFLRKNKQWVPLVDESDVMNKDLEEIEYKIVLYYDDML